MDGNKFVLYERVKYEDQFASIRDIPYTCPGEETIYVIRHSNNTFSEVLESRLGFTGEFESPLRYYELVQIVPNEDNVEAEEAGIKGSRGVVTGMVLDDKTDKWFFGVAIQSGEEWCFDQEELKGLGLIVSLEERYPSDNPDLVVKVDMSNSHGTVIKGDVQNIPKGLTPLPFDLDNLIL